MKDFVVWTSTALAGCWISYVITAVLLMAYRVRTGRVLRGPINTVWKWTKWPALAYVVTIPASRAIVVGEVTWFDWLSTVWLLWAWFRFRDVGDDDLGKRLKRRATEAVQRVGGKLVVVPAGSAR